MRTYFYGFACCVFLSGCSCLVPTYERPTIDMPEKWTTSNSLIEGYKDVSKEWWKNYNDPNLQSLIEEALNNSDDLKVSVAKLQQAHAQYDFAFRNQLPMVVGVGSASRLKADFNKDSLSPTLTPILPLLTPILPEKTTTNTSFIGAMLSYEVDLWGKLANQSHIAEASYLAMSYIRDAVEVSLLTTIAQLYFTIVALNENVELLEKQISFSEEIYVIMEKQYSQEITSQFILNQVSANLATIRAFLPKLKQQKEEAESALAVVVGRSPRDISSSFFEHQKHISSIFVIPITPSDTPSLLLERRPDIAAAEQALIASNFNIGVARAAYFPTISLESLLGLSSVEIKNIYKGPLHVWQIGTSMGTSLIDFGRTKAGTDLALAQNQEQIAIYKNVIRIAFKEVKDALSNQQNTMVAERDLDDKQNSIKKNLDMAHKRYMSGYASRLEVLKAEIDYEQAKMAFIEAKYNQLMASVVLYKALGGGWHLLEKH